MARHPRVATPQRTPSAPPATTRLVGHDAGVWLSEYRITVSPVPRHAPHVPARDLRDHHRLGLLDAALALDLPWEWPYACHRHGHVWEVGADRCSQCHAPYAEFGAEVATAVTRSSDGHVVQVAIPPGVVAP